MHLRVHKRRDRIFFSIDQDSGRPIHTGKGETLCAPEREAETGNLFFGGPRKFVRFALWHFCHSPLPVPMFVPRFLSAKSEFKIGNQQSFCYDRRVGVCDRARPSPSICDDASFAGGENQALLLWRKEKCVSR